MFLTEILIFLTTVIVSVTLWLKYHYNYWQRRNVPYVKAIPIFGNFKQLARWHMDPCTFFKRLYEEKDVVGGTGNDPVVGLHVFHKPCLLIRDLDLVRSIMVKDFNMFSDRYTSSDPHSDSMGANNLFFAKNPKWKEIRTKLTPVFTSGRMKQMFPLVEEIGRDLDKFLCALTENADQKSVIQEVKDINTLYTTDVIASVAFGVQAKSLENPNAEFRVNGKRVFNFTRWRAFQFTCMFFIPQLMSLLHLKAFSEKTTKFFRKSVVYVMNERKKSGLIRNDLIDVLVKFRREAETDKKHFANDLDAVIAQAALFFSAGSETASAAMSFSMYELAKRPEMQQRVRDEIREALQKSDNGQLSYEQINEMSYLNNFIMEVLRRYPPLSFFDRQCTASEGYSLKPYCDFTIPQGMPVYIPAIALQSDAKYFPEPETFQPDRFSPANKLYNNKAAYMPFGIGPHACIAGRLGLLQTKIGIINFLRNHRVSPCDKSHPEMKLNRYALLLQSEGGIYVNIQRDPVI